MVVPVADGGTWSEVGAVQENLSDVIRMIGVAVVIEGTHEWRVSSEEEAVVGWWVVGADDVGADDVGADVGADVSASVGAEVGGSVSSAGKGVGG
jgi:hypothetical protein